MALVRAKILIAGISLVGAAAYLCFASVKSDWVYFVDVDRFMQSHPTSTQRARVHGVVSVSGVEIRRADMLARFTLDGQANHLQVVYHGLLPEMFQAGREAVIEGVLDADGVFQADLLMTKCASKYEACDQPTHDRLETKQ